MPVRRDRRTRHWIFQATVKYADGTRKRLFGTPGIPGPYQDLARTQVGAIEAERRAISEAMFGRPLSPVALATEVQKTIREHAEGFVEKYKPGTKQSEKREKRRILKSHLLPYFGDMTIEGLTQTDIDTFASNELERGLAIKTMNNRLAVLSTLIKYVTGERSKLRFKLDGMTGELTAVSAADIELLLGACDDARYRAVILLASEAGLRAGEIRGLQWTDIKAGQLTVRRALDKQTNEATSPKHNKTRSVPLSPRLAEALEALPRIGLWVIAASGGSFVMYDDLKDTVNAIYGRAEVARPPKPIHCLRHSFGTVMAKRVPLPVLQTLMGHADIKTTLRYIDVDEQDKRDAIALVFGRASPVQATESASEGTDSK